MSRRGSPVLAWESTPLINVVSREHVDLFFVESLFIHQVAHATCARAGGHSTKEFVLSRLGKQSYVWTGHARNWVWERAAGESRRWRLFVSRRGLSFEVDPDATEADALAAWEDFKEALTRGLR